MGTGPSRSDVAQCQHVRQMSRALLTLMLAPAAGLGVGWLVQTGRWSGGDRLHRCEPDVRNIAANNGSCGASSRGGCDGAFRHACAGKSDV